MTFEEFLNKETPKEGGCMVCLARYKKKDYDLDLKKDVEKTREEYMLVERHKCANGEVFTINKKYYYDYDFIWDETMPWTVLYKREV